MTVNGMGRPPEEGCDEQLGLERYACMLKRRDLKVTSPRVHILQFLEGRDDHPTVDTIHSTVSEKVPSLSKTTVYSTLDLFRQEGLVRILTITPSELRYEFGQEVHHHLLCDECGTIYDIDVGCHCRGTVLDGEHKVKEVHGYFRGTCKHCLEAVAEVDDEEES
ncbi:MAG: transcriptional repressor [Thermoplasmata archaeon]|nr:transcriptional repressor [Thermoplasmata archaeon]